METNCLNCGEPVEKKFCAQCGQKTDTHRITAGHFLKHDLLHGVWHMDKGLLFTLKESIVRPGKAALDYISGKRVRYYNVFYLCLLLIGFNALLVFAYHKLVPNEDDPSGFVKVLKSYSKVFIFGIVPLLAINGWLLFKRWKLNLAEHCIVAGMALMGCLIASALFLVAVLFGHMTEWEIFSYFALFFFFLIPFVPLWTYSAFKPKYRFWGFSWRLLAFFLLSIAELVAIFVAIAYYTVGGDVEFSLML